MLSIEDQIAFVERQLSGLDETMKQCAEVGIPEGTTHLTDQITAFRSILATLKDVSAQR